MKIVMFSQTTCGPCKQLKPHLEAAAKQLGYEVEVWNVDDNWPLCQEWRVTYTPTVMVIDRVVGDVLVARLQTTDPKVQKPNALAIKAELEQYL
jgi:thiol-disulfide isomerase/thioredoxin